MVFCLFGIHRVMPYKVIELLASWKGKFGRYQNIDFWRFVLQCLFWCLWWEWNARCFENFERSILDIKSFFFRTLHEWNLVLPSCSYLSLSVPVIIVIWFFDCCHYSMFLAYLAFLFLIKYLTLFIKRIQLAIQASQNGSLFNIISRNYIKVTSLSLPTSRRINSKS